VAIENIKRTQALVYLSAAGYERHVFLMFARYNHATFLLAAKISLHNIMKISLRRWAIYTCHLAPKKRVNKCDAFMDAAASREEVFFYVGKVFSQGRKHNGAPVVAAAPRPQRSAAGISFTEEFIKGWGSFSRKHIGSSDGGLSLGDKRRNKRRDRQTGGRHHGVKTPCSRGLLRCFTDISMSTGRRAFTIHLFTKKIAGYLSTMRRNS